jgi:hypothetical protein
MANNNIDLFLLRLRDLAKAHERLARGVPDVKSAEAVADNALKAVLKLLEDPEIDDLLNEFISAARNRLIEAPGDFDHELETRRSELVRAEASVMQRVGARKRDIEYLYVRYRDVQQFREKFPSDAAALRQCIVDLHQSTKVQLTESRTLARKEKKTRKRKLAQGITSAIFGTGVIAADTQLPLLFAFSYALGGSALHQALRDIVGEPAD